MQRYKMIEIDSDGVELISLHYTLPTPTKSRWRILDRKTGKTTDSGNTPKSKLKIK